MNTIRELPSSPLALPFPAGLDGEIGHYDSGRGFEEFVKRTSLNGGWQRRTQSAPFSVPTSNLVYSFFADDTGQFGTYNAGLSDGSYITTWKNRQGTGSNATQVSGGGNFTSGVLQKPILNGRSGVLFGGNLQRYEIANSHVDLKPFWATGTGEILMVLTPGYNGVATYDIFANTETASETGLELCFNSPNNQPILIVAGGTGTPKSIILATAPALTPNVANIVSYRLDGTNCIYGLDDLSTEATTALTTANFRDANGTRIMNLGGANSGSHPRFNGTLFALMVWTSPITATERKQLIADIKDYYRI